MKSIHCVTVQFPIVSSSDLGVVYTDDELVRLYRGVVTLARHHLCYKYFYILQIFFF